MCEKDHLPVGITCTDGGGGHVLLITGYDSKTGELTIKNPWGTTNTYNPVTGAWAALPKTTTVAAKSVAPAAEQAGAHQSIANSAREFSMNNGSMFVMHSNPVVLHTANGSVNVPPHAIAFVIQLGSEVGVYDLSDVHGNGVTYSVNGQDFTLGTGKALLISSAGRQQLSNSTIGKPIPCSDARVVSTADGVNVYRADFSYSAALNTSPQFAQFINSKSRDERQAADRLLKILAANEMAGAN